MDQTRQHENKTARLRPTLTRRSAVKLMALGVVGAGVGAGSTALITRFADSTARQYRFFTVAEAELVIELCEEIIPTDDVAGATEASVVHYIDRQLAGSLARYQHSYREGLASFSQACVQVGGKAFREMDGRQKREVMQLVEEGRAPVKAWATAGQRDFFRLLVDHTMQGFYGSPRHGGNREYASYRLLGVDYPQVIGQNRIERT